MCFLTHFLQYNTCTVLCLKILLFQIVIFQTKILWTLCNKHNFYQAFCFNFQHELVVHIVKIHSFMVLIWILWLFVTNCETKQGSVFFMLLPFSFCHFFLFLSYGGLPQRSIRSANHLFGIPLSYEMFSFKMSLNVLANISAFRFISS